MASAVAAQARPASAGGIQFTNPDSRLQSKFIARLDELGLRQHVAASTVRDGSLQFALAGEFAERFVPGWDTTSLCADLLLDTVASITDLDCEIVLAMLAAPAPLRFPSFGEFQAAIGIRRHIVLAARRTQLAFGTSEAERPPSHWTYRDGAGFILLPGVPLVEALEKATQPAPGEPLFAFSCYRATEYVILLAIARELGRVNPGLLARLQWQWETRSIKSGQYHDTFLYEYGSAQDPVPKGYYVPGDRVWFRNPDELSSDASGYEGSWVIYLGNGLFSNFWKRDRPYSLADKLVEIFHWRHGIYRDGEGELRMDETIVEARAQATLANPERMQEVIRRMGRWRDPNGVYAGGGCIDTSREFPRYVCEGTADIILPQT
jgi:hypothetical protein